MEEVGAAFDHVREVHGDVDAGPWFHIETNAARANLFAEGDLVFCPVFFNVEVVEDFGVASIEDVDGLRALIWRRKLSSLSI